MKNFRSLLVRSQYVSQLAGSVGEISFPTCLEAYYGALLQQKMGYGTKQQKRPGKQHEGITPKRADHVAPVDSMLDVSDNKDNMQKAITHFEGELAKLQVGRATPAMLDHLKVQAYGKLVTFNQVAVCTVRGPQLLAIRPYDVKLLKEIEKAIATSPLKLNSKQEKEEIVVQLSTPTSEALEAMIKVVKAEAEKARMTIRHERKKARSVVKELSNDEKQQAEKEITKLHDQFIKQIDTITKKKEDDIRKG
eukprot:TRINITY_DN9879_c0_g4_i1.p1 TRINITY_DN9879_c0_g4~~TRINITY_DN9879_c0_g4_i1.p1  ORF type:complete len:261 (-),score=45.24 TRINITY_DN9879_c0_g4_i1:226-975(-)